MSPERYQRLCALFDQAVQRPAAARAAFLDEVSAADPALRAELEQLLAHDQRARGEQLFQEPCPVNAKALLPGEEPPTLPPAPPAGEPDDTLVGLRLGPYLIEQRLGSGGMGSVYRALRADAYRQQVALKVIRPGLDSAEVLRRFHTERQALADLGHPHIARLLDGGTTDDGRPYLVMEYIDGEPLDRYCDRHRLGTRERVQLLLAVCAAVQHAHERGVVHRDLKPANVLVTADGAPKVTDFGLAKRLEGSPADASPTQTGAVLGTPSYMAPEQAGGVTKQVGPAADVYALGAILYKLVTGRPPFRAATPLDTLLQVLSEEPVPPSRLHPKLARDLETICLKCLQKEPPKRYASALDLAEDLGRFLRGEPIQARPVGRVERLWRWCRRHPARAAAAVLAVVTLVAVATLAVGYAFTLRLRSEQQQTRAALQEAEGQRRRADQLSARLALERGLALGEQGEAARGMLWLSHSLEIAPAHDADLRRDIRANLAIWRHQVHPLRVVLPHRGWVRAVAFRPDGKVCLTGGFDKAARLWWTSTGEACGKPLRHAAAVMAAAFRPDGKAVATGTEDGTVWLWETATGRPLGKPMRHDDCVWTVAFSPDGRTLLTGSRDKTARLWDVATGRQVGQPLDHQGEVWAVAFGPDGKSVVTAGEGRAPRLWDRGGAGKSRVAPWGHSDFWVTALAFSPDGKTVLTGSGTGIARLWDVATGKPLGPPLRHQRVVWAVGFSPDGKSFATAGTGGVARLWETATGKPLGAPLRHRDDVAALAFSPDGRTVLTASADRTARLWEVSTGKSLTTPLPHDGYVHTAVYSPNGKLVLTASPDQTGRLWDAGTGRLLGELGHRGITAGAFSPDGRIIVTTSSEGGYAAWLWEAATRRPVAGPLAHRALIRSVAFSPDGKMVLTGSRDKTARLWDAATGKLLHTLPHRDDVWAVAFSPDGKMVLTGSQDATARLWSAATGQSLAPPLRHEGWVVAVAFSPDGQTVLTGSAEGTARLWDAGTGKLRHTLPHRGGVNSVAFSPDGQTVVTASSDDWTARLWSAATGQAVGQPMPHQGPVYMAAFSPDSQTVLTGSGDGTARLWAAATGKPVGAPLRHEGPVFTVAFSPNGQTVLTGSWNKAQLWKPPAPVAGDVKRIVCWTQVITGLELDANTVARVLDAAAWQERRQRLDQLGGPPGP
jgi:WD40 repeat protein